MADKRKKGKTSKDLPKRKLTAAQLGKVKGGQVNLGAIRIGGRLGETELCASTTDTGTTGCPG